MREKNSHVYHEKENEIPFAAYENCLKISFSCFRHRAKCFLKICVGMQQTRVSNEGNSFNNKAIKQRAMMNFAYTFEFSLLVAVLNVFTEDKLGWVSLLLWLRGVRENDNESHHFPSTLLPRSTFISFGWLRVRSLPSVPSTQPRHAVWNMETFCLPQTFGYRFHLRPVRYCRTRDAPGKKLRQGGNGKLHAAEIQPKQCSPRGWHDLRHRRTTFGKQLFVVWCLGSPLSSPPLTLPDAFFLKR